MSLGVARGPAVSRVRGCRLVERVQQRPLQQFSSPRPLTPGFPAMTPAAGPPCPGCPGGDRGGIDVRTAQLGSGKPQQCPTGMRTYPPCVSERNPGKGRPWLPVGMGQDPGRPGCYSLPGCWYLCHRYMWLSTEKGFQNAPCFEGRR